MFVLSNPHTQIILIYEELLFFALPLVTPFPMAIRVDVRGYVFYTTNLVKTLYSAEAEYFTITASDITKGVTIQVEGEPYTVVNLKKVTRAQVDPT